ncbi:tyrosine-type recombinase/integrase [Arcicella lustrica]|uniref:Integrase arm-type DNA-binding domain-containing protein n=1 Tax=Arcicella lustrica TaxID=2984196 RepID=A0ABU5SGH9_9BACT|nr:integrase arm-type DNA-binding domain-containing protein [Arcicella sp. DC25W]MEA5426397.1 integrase arm-type DNA-binding domain-containing protein [Arcicella sp. DC25W]
MFLTDTQCKAAKPKEKTYKLSDSEGLYLEVLPTGGKYWRLKYRLHGKEKRLGLGVYPKISLLKAREEKQRIRNELSTGIDPLLQKALKKQEAAFESATTFKEVAKEWHSKGVETWDPRYAKTIMHRLEKYTFDEFGHYPLNILKPITILLCLQKVEQTAPEMARRVKQLVSHILRYAIVTERIDRDLTIGLETALKKYKKGHFASIDIEELPKLLVALHNHKTRLYRQTYLAIRIMLLTFVRTSELIEARWDEIDFESALWIIPAERMKMRSPHLVPLSFQVIAILKELRELNKHREHLFPSLPRPRKPMSKGTILMALKRMGFSNRMTGHGFRALALGILKEKLGYNHEIADRQLAHIPQKSTDRAYDRAHFLSKRVEMMQNYANYLDGVSQQAILEFVF